jgi:molybdopterin converting factor small subunit
MHVEFLGIPRERAGVSEVEVDAATFAELLGTLAAQFPALRELMTPGGLHASVAANLNGDAFISDPSTSFASSDRLIILSADAGG